jgi:hypothetical protein
MIAEIFPAMTMITIAKEVSVDNRGTRVIRADMVTGMVSKSEDHEFNMVATSVGIQIATTNVAENVTMEITDTGDITTRINTLHTTTGMGIPILTHVHQVAAEYPTNKTEHHGEDLRLCRVVK